jgi:hypothetical protein
MTTALSVVVRGPRVKPEEMRGMLEPVVEVDSRDARRFKTVGLIPLLASVGGIMALLLGLQWSFYVSAMRNMIHDSEEKMVVRGDVAYVASKVAEQKSLEYDRRFAQLEDVNRDNAIRMAKMESTLNSIQLSLEQLRTQRSREVQTLR